MSIAIYTYRDPYKLDKETFWTDIKTCPYFCASQTLVNGLRAVYKNDYKAGQVTTLQNLVDTMFESWESTKTIVKQHTDIDNIIAAGLPILLNETMQNNIKKAFLFNREEVFESIRVMFELNMNVSEILMNLILINQFRKHLKKVTKKECLIL